MPHASWKLLGSHYVKDYKVLRVREDRYRFEPSAAEAEFIVCDSADWVLVLPITTAGEVVFIRQYRHGVRQVVLEVPGGMIDSGEQLEASAARELREETGFVAERLERVGTLLPNPALNSASFHVVVAEGCHRAGNPQFDGLEQIEVVLRPLAEVPKMIRAGEFCHAQAIAAFTLWDLRSGRGLFSQTPAGKPA